MKCEEEEDPSVLGINTVEAVRTDILLRSIPCQNSFSFLRAMEGASE